MNGQLAAGKTLEEIKLTDHAVVGSDGRSVSQAFYHSKNPAIDFNSDGVVDFGDLAGYTSTYENHLANCQ